MAENMDTGFDEFFDSFDGGDGYQTDTVEETAEVTEEETTEAADTDTEQEDTEEPESGETAGEESTEEADKDGAEDNSEADKPVSEQKFTIKVNKELKEVSYEDAPAWIQKGMDYDRVKNQLETSRENERTLQEELAKHKPFMDFLAMASEQAGTSEEQLVENLHINLLKSKGMTEAEAKAEIRAAKAEKQVKDLTAQKAEAEKPAEDAKTRMQKDIAEFQAAYPGVTLSDEQIEKMGADIQKGVSMVNAYRNMKDAEKDAEIAELKRQLEAASQNKKNKAKTPGSMKDSGGQRKKTAEDDFFSAFEK